MRNDYFEKKANSYEQDDQRVSNVASIAKSILEKFDLDQSMHLMDFGSGTGLLLERIAPYVRKITAVDISQSMNQQLRLKQNDLECELEILEIDLVSESLSKKFDGIVSSMTMHHVKDTVGIFEKLYNLLEDRGIIAIADLDSEDGTFHTEDTGVHHFGFDRKSISQIASNAGFQNVEITDASVVKKPHGDYPVFLLTAEK